MTNSTFREFVLANMFDGVDAGMVTMYTSALLDELEELYQLYIEGEGSES